MINGIQSLDNGILSLVKDFQQTKQQQIETSIEIPSDHVNISTQMPSLDEEAKEAMNAVQNDLFNNEINAASVHSGLSLSRVLELLAD